MEQFSEQLNLHKETKQRSLVLFACQSMRGKQLPVNLELGLGYHNCKEAQKTL